MANGIKIGNLDISAFKVGSSDCKVYLGDALLYPNVETRVIAKFNVTDTSSPTQIGYDEYISGFSAIEIDGVVQPSVVSAYTFSTTGEHTVKYTLTDPTSISDHVFEGCGGLISIVMPNNITNLGEYTFYNCSGLTSINIPSGVTSIGFMAFSDCKSLTGITCLAVTPPSLESSVFSSTNSCPIYVPSGSVNAYKAASSWSSYTSRIQAIP